MDGEGRHGAALLRISPTGPIDPDDALQALEMLAWPVSVLAADGRTVRMANAAARRLLGLRPGPLDLESPQWSALAALIEAGRSGHHEPAPWHRLVGGQHEAWMVQVLAQPFGLLLSAQDLTPQRALEAQRERQAAAHRELLLREVHHRLKNTLQGVAGLLEHFGHEHPQARPQLQQAACQVLAVAEVYGLSGREGLAPTVAELVRSLCANLGALFRREIDFEPGLEPSGAGDGPQPGTPGLPAAAEPTPDPDALGRLLWRHLEEPAEGGDGRTAEWRLRADDAPAIALCLNELLTNALKHAPEQAPQVSCRVVPAAEGVTVEIRNAGVLPAGAGTRPPSADSSGLGLVSSLMPSRGARWELKMQDGQVCARLHIGPPCAQPEAQGDRQWSESL